MTPGNLVSVDDVFQEMVRQFTLFKKDSNLYQRYIHEFTISCLMDTKTKTNYSKCSDSALKFLTDVETTDISAAATVENMNVKKKLLETNLASIDRYGTYPSGLTVNINNEFIRVDAFNPGSVHQREAVSITVYRSESAAGHLQTKGSLKHLQADHWRIYLSIFIRVPEFLSIFDSWPDCGLPGLHRSLN